MAATAHRAQSHLRRGGPTLAHPAADHPLSSGASGIWANAQSHARIRLAILVVFSLAPPVRLRYHAAGSDCIGGNVDDPRL